MTKPLEDKNEMSREQLDICEDISQFLMFLVFVVTSFVLVVILREVYPFEPSGEELPKKIGTAEFWIPVYSIVGLCMLYAWGLKPFLRLRKNTEFAVSRLGIVKSLFSSVLSWGIGFGFVFVTGSMMLEVAEKGLSDSLQMVANLLIITSLLFAWYAVDHMRHSSVMRALNQPITKQPPWQSFVKAVQKRRG